MENPPGKVEQRVSHVMISKKDYDIMITHVFRFIYHEEGHLRIVN